MVAVSRVVFSFWPGVLRLWRDGDFHALVIALLFGCSLSIGWTATFIWPLWLAPWKAYVLWTLIVGAVVCSFLHSLFTGLMLGRGGPVFCSDQVLLEAQLFYLQANYFEAERLVSPYVGGKRPDVEAAILLASIFRRTGRWGQAIELLDSIEGLDRAQRWREEIVREKKAAIKMKIQPQIESAA